MTFFIQEHYNRYQFDFNDLDSLPIPDAIEGHNSIVLLIGHVLDGVGDYIHGLHFGEMIQKVAKEKGYTVTAVVTISGPWTNKKRLQALEDMISKGPHPFDNVFLIKDYREGVSKEVIQALSKAACALTISYKPSINFKPYLPANVFNIPCLQFGSRSDHESADMGLDISRPVCYGIPLLDLSMDKPVALIDSIQDRGFIRALLAGNTAEQYLANRRMVPGYIQNKSAAAAFALTNILRFFKDGKFTPGCDLFLPKDMVDPEIINALLEHVGLTVPITYITPSGVTGSNDPLAVRIFSGFYLDDEEYKKLYQISGDLGGCSGDNSTSLVITSGALPYLQYRSDQLGSFYKDLVKLVKDQASYSEEPLKTKLTILSQYFEHLCTIDTRNYEKDDLLSKEDAEKFILWCQKAADYLSNVDLWDAWRVIQHHIVENYDYRQSFPNVLKAGLYFSSPMDPALKELLLQRSEFADVDKLMKAGFINAEDTLSIDMLLVLGNERINNFILTHEINFEQLKEQINLHTNPKEALRRQIDKLGFALQYKGNFAEKPVAAELTSQPSPRAS